MTSKIAVIITAAGSSTRMGSSIKKEFLPLENGTVLSGCANAFLTACLEKYEITNFIITCKAGSEADAKNALASITGYSAFEFVEGGATRQVSVFNGMKAIKENGKNPDIVLIHDGARPFVTEKIILDSIEVALQYGAAAPGITPVDTQKEIDENGFIKRHLVRSRLIAIQTPQVFRFNELFEAHQKASLMEKEFTDDTEIWGNFCGNVKIVEGDALNKKITYKGDL